MAAPAHDTRPGDRLFGRLCSLIVAPAAASGFGPATAGTVQFSGLRTTFAISKSLRSNPNTNTITVYNLAPDSRAALKKGSHVVLQAGYEGTLEQIFAGDIRVAPSLHQAPEWVTTIELDDGGRGFVHGRVLDSFRGKVAAGKVLRRVAEAMGVGLGNVPQVCAALDRHAQYENGIVLRGRAASQMDRITAVWGLSWSIQDGQIQVIADGASLADTVVLSPDTGLVGAPEMGTAKKKGGKALMKIKSLLQGKIRPGTRIKLESEQHRGLFRAELVNHNGDTHGQPFYTDVEASPTT